MNFNRERKVFYAKLGNFIKGVVYVLSGGLAISILGKRTDGELLSLIKSWSYGKTILIIIVVGVFLFALYRLYQALIDPGKEGILVRGGYIGSGLAYLFAGFTFLQLTFGIGGEVVEYKDSMLRTIMATPIGKTFSGIAGSILSGKSIFQFYKAFSGRYRRKIQNSDIEVKGKGLLTRLGKIGYSSRGVSFLIVAILVYRAGFIEESSLQEVINFFGDGVGIAGLPIFGLGVLLYGLFMIVKSRYSQIDVR